MHYAQHYGQATVHPGAAYGTVLVPVSTYHYALSSPYAAVRVWVGCRGWFVVAWAGGAGG